MINNTNDSSPTTTETAETAKRWKSTLKRTFEMFDTDDDGLLEPVELRNLFDYFSINQQVISEAPEVIQFNQLCRIIENSEFDCVSLINAKEENYEHEKGYREAAALYSISISLDPTDISLYFQRASILMKYDLYRAIQDYTVCIQNNWKREAALCLRGYCYLKMNCLEEAERDANEALQIDQSYINAFKLKAEVYIKCNQHKDAENQIQNAIRVNSFDAETRLLLAVIQMEHHNYQEVINSCTEAINFDPLICGAYFLRSRAQRMVGTELKQAITDNSRAIELDPYHPELYFHRGNLYLETGDLSNALTDLLKAVELSPGNAEYRLTLAKCYSSQGHNDKAIEELTHSIQNDPSCAQSYLQRAKCFYNNKQYLESIQDYNYILDQQSNNAEAIIGKSKALAFQHEFKKAFSSATDPLLKAFSSKTEQ